MTAMPDPPMTAAQMRRAASADRQIPLVIAGVDVVATADGALWIPGRRSLVIADLHFEKGSSFARRGRFIPPYDTAETLSRLERLIDHFDPDEVIALGDSFHDPLAPARLDPQNADRLSALATARSWVWITGNHDPDMTLPFGGAVRKSVTVGSLTLRHEPDPSVGIGQTGEIAGHFHPKAVVQTRLARLTGPCFVYDATRLIMPAFGAFTGGLAADDAAIRSLFPNGGRTIVMVRGRMIENPLV